jgi:hypothetical protein
MQTELRVVAAIAAAAAWAGCASEPGAAAGKPAAATEKAPEPAGAPGTNAKADSLPAAAAPVIDGTLGDAAWQGRRIPGRFVNVDDNEPAKVASAVFVTYDDANIYLAFDLDEPSVKGIVAQATAHDESVWEDDSVEIFLDPANGKKDANYYQFIVNTKGVVYDGQVGDSGWDGHAKTAAKVLANKWTVEVQIPLKDLGVTGSPRGQTWLANFCRNRQADGSQHLAWSDVGTDFHNWEAFGHITFK